MREMVSRRIGVPVPQVLHADGIDMNFFMTAQQRDNAGHLAAFDMTGH